MTTSLQIVIQQAVENVAAEYPRKIRVVDPGPYFEGHRCYEVLTRSDIIPY
jgi:hypothetical protein